MKKDQIVKLYEQGVSGPKIALQLKCGKQYVYRVLAKADIKTRSDKTEESLELKVIEIRKEKGYSYIKISKILDGAISAGTVKNILKRNNLLSGTQRIDLSENIIDKVKITYLEGNSQRETAKKLQIDHYIVRKVLNRLGISRGRRTLDRLKICKEYKAGKSINEIAGIYTTSPNMVGDILRGENIIPEIGRRGKTSKRWKGIGDIRVAFFNTIKFSAQQRDIEFDVTIEYIWDLFIIQKNKCSLSGLNLEMGPSALDDRTASLDRIDSSKGYIEGNVQWVHKMINTMKWDFNQDDFIKMCTAIYLNNQYPE
jgi:transposase